MAAEPIVDYVLPDHALAELARREMKEQEIDLMLLRNPGQRLELRPGRVVLQSKCRKGRTEYLLRVCVDVDRTPCEVVTAYRTSKIEKYWRGK